MEGRATTDTIYAFLAELTALLADHVITRRTTIIQKRQRRRRSPTHTQSVHRQRRSFDECKRYLNDLQFTRTFRMPCHIYF
eukprot:IDg21172t1